MRATTASSARTMPASGSMPWRSPIPACKEGSPAVKPRAAQLSATHRAHHPPWAECTNVLSAHTEPSGYVMRPKPPPGRAGPRASPQR